MAIISVVMVVGTLGDGGLDSSWRWIGLVFVPVLLRLVEAAGTHH